ncbi:MAG: hypothetical protein PWQ72_1226 [Pseudothermotoga sp.]|nr:hypothetical protein [Pseudothermotoga sp.]
MKFKVLVENIGKDKDYKYFVIMLSVEKPFDLLKEITGKLRKLGKGKGKVLFDTTLGNLNKQERYIEAYFDGEKIDISSFRVVKEPPEYYLGKSFEYLSRNYSEYVEKSFLTSAEKFRYKNQIFTR